MFKINHPMHARQPRSLFDLHPIFIFPLRDFSLNHIFTLINPLASRRFLLAAKNPTAFYYADRFDHLYPFSCYCVLAIIRRTSKIPGVLITQCVTELPDGTSTPDFQFKLEPISISEGRPRHRTPVNLSELVAVTQAKATRPFGVKTIVIRLVFRKNCCI